MPWQKKNVLPARGFESVEEFQELTGGLEEILLDGTENSTERPQNHDLQEEMYSGKKHGHTDVSLVMSDKRRFIYYVSLLYVGSANDMGVLKSEFGPGKGWFAKLRVIVDLGFVGMDKVYDIMELLIGHKRKRRKKGQQRDELTKEQKEHNKMVSKERIYVEHAIGGVKRFRVLVNRCRIKCYDRKNRELGICAGLHNYKIST